MRLSKGHVRENRSWKIITRLRHILTYLPDDWQSNIDEVLKEKKYTSAKDAKISSCLCFRLGEIGSSQMLQGRIYTANYSRQKMRNINKI